MEEERVPEEQVEIIDLMEIDESSGDEGAGGDGPCDSTVTPTTPISTTADADAGEEQLSPETKSLLKRKRFEAEKDIADVVALPTVKLPGTPRASAVPVSKMSGQRGIPVSTTVLSNTSRGTAGPTTHQTTTPYRAAGWSTQYPPPFSGVPTPKLHTLPPDEVTIHPTAQVPSTSRGAAGPTTTALPRASNGAARPTTELPRTSSNGAAKQTIISTRTEGACNLTPETKVLLNFDTQFEKLTNDVKMLRLKKERIDKLNKSDFWSTQPVPKFGEVHYVSEPIQPNIPIDYVRKEPYTLPDGFVWDTLNLDDALHFREVHTLLNNNYVETDETRFNMTYSDEFLKRALQPPGWKVEWSCGVRVQKNGKLVAYVTAVPISIKLLSKRMDIVEVNYMCVHQKLRTKRVTPVLIREITRRVNLAGIFQAVYSAGRSMPKPVAGCSYFHRSLDVRKLVEVGFTKLPERMTLERSIKLHILPEEPRCEGIRQLTKNDCPSALKLLTSYVTRFKLAPIFTLEEFEHWFLPREKVVSTFVIGSEDNITDLASFFYIPVELIKHPFHTSVESVYSFYNVATSVTLQQLIFDMMVLAKNDGNDVFNSLDVSMKSEPLRRMQFGMGQGKLNYYIFNWKCPPLYPENISLVLQ